MKIESLADLEYEIDKYRPITIEKMINLFNKIAEKQAIQDIENLKNLVATLEATNALGKEVNRSRKS